MEPWLSPMRTLPGEAQIQVMSASYWVSCCQRLDPGMRTLNMSVFLSVSASVPESVFVSKKLNCLHYRIMDKRIEQGDTFERDIRRRIPRLTTGER
jgi:hypothetical protein